MFYLDVEMPQNATREFSFYIMYLYNIKYPFQPIEMPKSILINSLKQVFRMSGKMIAVINRHHRQCMRTRKNRLYLAERKTEIEIEMNVFFN